MTFFDQQKPQTGNYLSAVFHFAQTPGFLTFYKAFDDMGVYYIRLFVTNKVNPCSAAPFSLSVADLFIQQRFFKIKPVKAQHISEHRYQRDHQQHGQ